VSFLILNLPHNVSHMLLSTKLAMEAQHGLISQVLKDYIFGNRQDLKESLNVLNTAIASDT
jgi:hypothetical protein